MISKDNVHKIQQRPQTQRPNKFQMDCVFWENGRREHEENNLLNKVKRSGVHRYVSFKAVKESKHKLERYFVSRYFVSQSFARLKNCFCSINLFVKPFFCVYYLGGFSDLRDIPYRR